MKKIVNKLLNDASKRFERFVMLDSGGRSQSIAEGEIKAYNTILGIEKVIVELHVTSNEGEDDLDFIVIFSLKPIDINQLRKEIESYEEYESYGFNYMTVIDCLRDRHPDWDVSRLTHNLHVVI